MSSPTVRRSPSDSPSGSLPDSPAASAGRDAGLLLFRLAVGLTLGAHGVRKLFGWFGGEGLDGTERVFASIGYPAAEAMAVLAAVSETFGGLALALGLLTPLAAAAILGVMLNAVVAVHWGDGFFSPGVEYPLVLGACSAALALTGPGRYAADRLVPALATRLSHPLAGPAAIALGAVSAAVVLLLRG